MPKTLVLPPLRRTEQDAWTFARVAHRGQTDKSGVPYSQHVAGVADRVSAKIAPDVPWRDEALQIAWLHDVIEDTEYTAEDLRAEGFSNEVVNGVEYLTNTASVRHAYRSWIYSLAAHAPLPVLLVKIADIEDNSDPERLALLPDDVRARLERKYAPALVILREAAVRLGWKPPELEPTR